MASPTSPPVGTPSSTSAASRSAHRRIVGYAGLHKLMNPPTQPIGSTSTKGLMEKFLASHGKVTTVVPTFHSAEPAARAVVKTPPRAPVVKAVRQKNPNSRHE